MSFEVKNSASFEKIKAGQHEVRIVGIIDHGLVKGGPGFSDSEPLTYLMLTSVEDGGAFVYITCTPTWGTKSKYRKWMAQWTGADSKIAVAPLSLLGKQGTAIIAMNEKGYPEISGMFGGIKDPDRVFPNQTIIHDWMKSKGSKFEVRFVEGVTEKAIKQGVEAKLAAYANATPAAAPIVVAPAPVVTPAAAPVTLLVPTPKPVSDLPF